MTVRDTIHVFDNTVVTISGEGRGAAALGNTQLLHLVNATLEISNIQIQNCFANAGGAIFEAGLAVNLHNVIFQNNSARFGGAMFVDDGSNVTWSGELGFSQRRGCNWGCYLCAK